jgi:uncharacterized RDD family membrane protein YckC
MVQPAYGQQVGYPYASWIRRVGGYLIDAIITGLVSLPAIIVMVVGLVVGLQDVETVTDSTTGETTTTGDWNSSGTPLLIVGALLFLLPLAFYIWNYFIRQGRTGRTIGKGVVDIKLISERTGQPIGAGAAFVRQICHILDGIFYIGYLWPLWDAKRQTFADKIMSTVVINEPQAPTIP